MAIAPNIGGRPDEIVLNTFPDPIRPLRWMRAAIVIGTAMLVVWCVLLPHLAVLYLLLLPALAVAWRFASVRIHDEDLDVYNMFRSRRFSLPEARVHPEDARRHAAESRLPPSQRRGKWYRQRLPGSESYQQVELVAQPDGTTTPVGYWRRRLIAEQRASCQAMLRHLREVAPAVYQRVMAWWQECHADKVAHQLWPGKRYRDLIEADQQVVRTRTEVECYQGVFIALRPDTWRTRFDRRPSHRSFALLRQVLLRDIAPQDVPSQAAIDAAPWPMVMRREWIYWGDGYLVDVEHAQKFYFQKFFSQTPHRSWLAQAGWRYADNVWRPPSLFSLGGIIRWCRKLQPLYRATEAAALDWATDKDAQNSSRWIQGLGWRQEEHIWSHYDADLPQHTLIAGGSGYGKTRLVESPLIQAIYNHSAVIWLDPKVDGDACALIAHHAERAGRLDDLVFLSVSRAEIPYNSKFNPLSGFHDPAQIGNILAGMLPEDAGQNQFFVDEAKNIGRIVGTTVYWLNQWLALLSNGDELCWHPPRLLLWIEYARLRGLHQVPPNESLEHRRSLVRDARAAFEVIVARLKKDDRGFVAGDEHELVLFQMWCQREYSAAGWKLHFGHLNDYALYNRQRLVSWAMRLVYPYVCAMDERFTDIRFPLSDTLELVSGYTKQQRSAAANEPPKPTLIELFERSGPHLLAREGLLTADRTRSMWSYIVEQELPVALLPRIQHWLVRFERVWSECVGQSKRDPDEYGQAVANLRAPITEIIAGEKFDLLCASDPDITFKRICDEKLVVILALGSMSDQKASDAVSKAFTQALLAHGGYTQDHGGTDLDLLFVGDEMFSWVNSYWASVIDKLRTCGVRTVGLCQSEPGMRAAIKNGDLFKHISASVRNRFICTTNLEEDQKNFCESMDEPQIYVPNRTVSENNALGDSANKQVAGWSTGENWSWSPTAQPLIDPKMLGWMPKGCFIRRVQKTVHCFQAPYIARAPVSYLAQVGMDAKNNQVEHGGRKIPILIDGIDFGVDAVEDVRRITTWASDARLANVLAGEERHDIDTGELSEGHTVQQNLAKTGYVGLDFRAFTGQDQAASDGGAAAEPAVPAHAQALPNEDDRNSALAESHALDGTPPIDPTPAELAVIASTPAATTVPQPPARREMVRCTEEGLTAIGMFDPELGCRVHHWSWVWAHGTLARRGQFTAQGRQDGVWEYCDARGLVVQRAYWLDGSLLRLEPEAPPSAPVALPDPQSKPIAVEETTAEGWRLSGKRRGTCRVGIWILRRPDGTKAEIRYYGNDGAPSRQWERYDANDELIEQFEPVADD